MTLSMALAQTAFVVGFAALFILIYGTIDGPTWARWAGSFFALTSIGLVIASIWVQV